MTDKGTCSDTSDTCGGEHSSRVALVLLLLLYSGGTGSCVVVVPAVAVCVTKEASLIVAGCGVVGSTGGRRGVRARGQVRGRVPLHAACSLLDIVPALAVLIPLGRPAGGHGRWGTVRSRWALGRWRTASIVSLRSAVLALRGAAVLLGWASALR